MIVKAGLRNFSCPMNSHTTERACPRAHSSQYVSIHWIWCQVHTLNHPCSSTCTLQIYSGRVFHNFDLIKEYEFWRSAFKNVYLTAFHFNIFFYTKSNSLSFSCVNILEVTHSPLHSPKLLSLNHGLQSPRVTMLLWWFERRMARWNLCPGRGHISPALTVIGLWL